MDIICHAFPAWEGNYVKSTVELMKAAALQGHRVLYVDYAYTWTDFVKSIFGKNPASWRRMIGWQPRLRRIELAAKKPDMGAISVLLLPPVIPSNFIKNTAVYDAICRVNAYFMGKYIRKAAKTLKFSQPTVINAFNPAFGQALAGKLQERNLVYYCYDEISAAKWAKKHGARLEQAFVQKCDQVIVSSEGLLQKHQTRHKSTFLVKNGVDIDLFSKENNPDTAVIIPNLGLNQAVIGYLGSIDDRLNFDLLERLFERFAEARFVFVGRVQSKDIEKRLSAYPNVFLSGAKSPAELPDWVAKMDVCLIPFVKNEFTAGIYPLKVNEYLAMGKAVVSTDFAPLNDFESVIAIAQTDDVFEQAVGEALTQKNLHFSEKRKAFARQNSWQERARLLVAICSQKQG